MLSTAELTPAEASALEHAGELGSGDLAEALAGLAFTAAFQADVSPELLRELGALALELARRLDAARALPDD